MKGNDKVIQFLNERLADELTAVNQYFLHAEMCESWGYDKLYKATRERSIQEMRHAERLIARILYLEGKPVVSKLNEIRIGTAVPDQLRFDLEAEKDANAKYNANIKTAMELGDNGTRELLEKNLLEEEGHIDWLEAQLEMIESVGLQNYLAAQIS